MLYVYIINLIDIATIVIECIYVGTIKFVFYLKKILSIWKTIKYVTVVSNYALIVYFIDRNLLIYGKKFFMLKNICFILNINFSDAGVVLKINYL